MTELTDTISFDEAIAVSAAPGGNGYEGFSHPSWNGPISLHGGVLAAIALRAIDAEVNADRSLQVRTLSCHFLKAPKNEAVRIEVEPLKVGRRFVSSRALIKQGDFVLVTVLATHSARSLTEPARWYPGLPPHSPSPSREAAKLEPFDYRPDAGGWVRMPEQSPAFFQRLLVAPQFGHPIFGGPPVANGDGTENGGWVMLPESRPVDAEYLTFCVDAFWPSVLQPMRDPVVAPTLDITIHFRSELPPEGLPDQPLLIHNTTAATLDGLADSDSRVYTADGLLLAQARQLQVLIPVEM